MHTARVRADDVAGIPVAVVPFGLEEQPVRRVLGAGAVQIVRDALQELDALELRHESIVRAPALHDRQLVAEVRA